jgi:DNA-binding NarL/FixJ family response regulator
MRKLCSSITAHRLDVLLPGGGPAAAGGILQSSPRTAVIAISAYTDGGTVGRTMAAGAVSYLAKGRSTMVDIISAIERAADVR